MKKADLHHHLRLHDKHRPPLFLPEGHKVPEIWATLKKTNLALAFIASRLHRHGHLPVLIQVVEVAGRHGAVRGDLHGPAHRHVHQQRASRAGWARLPGATCCRHKKGLSFTYAFSTVLLDRFFDLTGLLLLTLVFFPRASLPRGSPRAFTSVIGVVVLLRLMIILLSRESSRTASRKGS